jgi:hypothetical protein
MLFLLDLEVHCFKLLAIRGIIPRSLEIIVHVARTLVVVRKCFPCTRLLARRCQVPDK